MLQRGFSVFVFSGLLLCGFLVLFELDRPSLEFVEIALFYLGAGSLLIGFVMFIVLGVFPRIVTAYYRDVASKSEKVDFGPLEIFLIDEGRP